MSIAAIDIIYEQHIRRLSPEQQLRLLALIAERLAAANVPAKEPRTHSILELDGLGKEIWEGIDAQEYVNALRAEWDERTW
jgi:hypothetical protein